MPIVATELRFTRSAHEALFELLEPDLIELVMDLAHDLAADLPEIVDTMPDSDALVATFGIVTFVCFRSQREAAVWRIVRVYIGDPHDTPPGGGLGAVKLREDTGSAVQRGLPTGFAWLVSPGDGTPAAGAPAQFSPVSTPRVDLFLRPGPTTDRFAETGCITRQASAAIETGKKRATRGKVQTQTVLSNADPATYGSIWEGQALDKERANRNAANEIKPSALENESKPGRPNDPWPQTLPRPYPRFLWQQIDYGL